MAQGYCTSVVRLHKAVESFSNPGLYRFLVLVNVNLSFSLFNIYGLYSALEEWKGAEMWTLLCSLPFLLTLPFHARNLHGRKSLL